MPAIPDKPHLVIFNPDQWRGDALGYVGNRAAQTPNLDRFVREEAVGFRWAFCQNPVCTPSRCSFMTGWYPHVRGHRSMYHMLHPEHGEPNLLARLKAEGYHILWAGKNDLVPGQGGDPFSAYCAERYRTHHDGVPDRWTDFPWMKHENPDWRGPPGGDNYYSFHVGRLLPATSREEADFGAYAYYIHNDWGIIYKALETIRAYDPASSKPLCLYLALEYPHPPYACEDPWHSAIERDAIPARIPAAPEDAGKPRAEAAIREHQNLGGWSEARWSELRATYYAMCARVDAQFQMIVEALREKGLYDDTALFFFSDHGDYTGDYGMVEKAQNLFEDPLTRVPFAIKPPKNHPVRPRVSDALVELVDFPATVFDLLGLEAGYDHFGRSLLGLLAGETEEHRDAVFCEGGRRHGETQAGERQSASSSDPAGLYWPRSHLQEIEEPLYHNRAVMCRTHRHKYVARYDEADEFYDLEDDPTETRNRIDDPACAQAIATLRARLVQWFVETADVVPRTEDSR
jgi:arylsulfatase A-like enzyme